MTQSLVPTNVTQLIEGLDFKLLSYDPETNTIVVNNEDNPLTIAFKGDFHLAVDGDFEIESNGQVDIVSHDKTICLDSLGSRIYFNSRRTKHCMKKLDRFEGATRKVIEGHGGSKRGEYDQMRMLEIEQVVYKLQDRIIELENQLGE